VDCTTDGHDFRGEHAGAVVLPEPLHAQLESSGRAAGPAATESVDDRAGNTFRYAVDRGEPSLNGRALWRFAGRFT